MTVSAQGKRTGALPAPPTGDFLGLVHQIIFSPDPTATTLVSILQGANIIRTFNIPAAAGANDGVFFLKSFGEENLLDPTQFSVNSTGCYVTYCWA